MLFNSLTFAAFCLVTFILYYLPFTRKVQATILILASFVFYGASSPILLLLLVFSIVLNSFTSYMVCVRPRAEQIYWAAGGVIANLAVLSFFKYGGLLTRLAMNFFSSKSSGVVNALLHIPLPIGISFYTFEGVSLLVDVIRYKRGTSLVPDTEGGMRQNFEAPQFSTHLLKSSLFISFFPHLVAGPILKARLFYPQIQPKRFGDIPWGIVYRSLILGYFLKMVVADNLAGFTFWIAYPYYQAFGTLTNATLLFGYSMQIFADFAGYSLIAIGIAAGFGYTLPANFNRPYLSRSLAEFWTRWHISLSTWLRDYLYIPLGGNRRRPMRVYFNLLVVMVLGGLWHGAAWGYAIWGAYHGIGLALERFVLGRKHEKPPENQIGPMWLEFLRDSSRIVLVFVFISIGWLFFKLTDAHQSIEFLTTLTRVRIAPDPIAILSTLLYSLPVVVYHAWAHPTFYEWRVRYVNAHPRIWQGTESALYGVMLAMLILNSGSSNAFIYFQF